ncbi:hypothetical protein GCM10023321_20440 [Pseudonocardia eucalypti]|uniref:DUF6457 domain-containing protein n=1 Tax=Pseudonocardia eucalypti TaxID=648755 RepID=A0ABP9PZ19_9PSEU|nr:hypothetical protein [Pseudonocardia eucalypti]
MNTMETWIAEVCAELGIDLADQKATTAQVLDLTKDVAHGVARPAAPVTAFLVGLAAARTDDPDAAVADLCTRLAARASGWSGEG